MTYYRDIVASLPMEGIDFYPTINDRSEDEEYRMHTKYTWLVSVQHRNVGLNSSDLELASRMI